MSTVNDTTDEAHGSLTMTVNSGTGYTVGSPSSASVTVYDNDDPTVYLERISTSITEGQTALVRVKATSAFSGTIKFRPTESGDFSLHKGDTQWEVSNWSEGTFHEYTVNDSVDEPDGSVTLTLLPGTGYTVGSPSSITVTVRDNDVAALPVITVSRYSSSVTEGGTVYFRVHSNKAVPANLSVSFSRSQNGAFASWSGSGTVTIPSGATQSGWVSVSTVNDSTDEAHGSLTMSLNSGTGYTVGSPSSASVTVNDNDVAALPVVTVSRSQSSVTEGNSAWFTVDVDRNPAQAGGQVNVWVTETGNCVGSWTGAGTRPLKRGGWSVYTVDDSVDEPDCTITASIRPGTGYTVGSPSSATVTVYDNDDPTVYLERISTSITEGQTALVRVKATSAFSGTIKLRRTESGVFYRHKGDTQWVVGNWSEGTFYGYTVNDSVDEPDGSVTLTLLPGTGYTVGSPSSITVTVNDNDVAATTTTTTTAVVVPTVTITRTWSSVTEGNSAWFTVVVDRNPAQAGGQVNVWVTETGNCVGSWTGAGTRPLKRGGWSVYTVDDSVDEPDCTITASIRPGTGYTVGSPSSATVTVYDND